MICCVPKGALITIPSNGFVKRSSSFYDHHRFSRIGEMGDIKCLLRTETPYRILSNFSCTFLVGWSVSRERRLPHYSTLQMRKYLRWNGLGNMASQRLFSPL